MMMQEFCCCYAWVCSGYCSCILSRVTYEHQKVISHSSGGWKIQVDDVESIWWVPTFLVLWVWMWVLDSYLGFQVHLFQVKEMEQGHFVSNRKKDNLLRKGKYPSPRMCGASEQGLEACSPVWTIYRTPTSLFLYPGFFLSMQFVICTLDWSFLNN